MAWLRIVAVAAVLLGAAAAGAGLVWTPPGEVIGAPELYGRGLYRRDTPFVAGGAQGADLLTLLAAVPAALWALAGRIDRRRALVLVVALSWLLYVAASLALGAIAFNEAFPLYVLLMPVSAAGLALALRALGPVRAPRSLAVFLAACGLATAMAWALLLWQEMTSGAFPPTGYYTARTTYALDLGVIAPGCLVAALALWRRWPGRLALALPLLALAATLLPMMALQTAMQLRAGVRFGPEAAVPLAAFGLLSAVAAWFLWRIARGPGAAAAEGGAR